MIAPHLSNRKRKHQDGRPLRRYKRRWKVERTIAWLGNYRRLLIRWEYYATNFLGFELDRQLAAQAQELTPASIPEDFRRTVHRCWRFCA